MSSVERTITVDRPVEAVWTYLTDFSTTEQWDPPTVSTVRTSGDGGVGTTYRNVSKVLGHEATVDYEVVAYEPYERFELVGSASGLDLHDTMSFSSDGTSTTVTYRAEFTPRGAAKLATPLIAGGIEVLGSRVASSLEEHLLAL
ncbi:SRPBCC family protein [Nocardioides caeni]|nr:SRPBCC family protein [Nocardioides caeni]